MDNDTINSIFMTKKVKDSRYFSMSLFLPKVDTEEADNSHTTKIQLF